MSRRRSEEQTKEALDALAHRVWETQERERRRTMMVVLRLILFLVLPLATVIAWLATSGYQHHVVEMRVGDSGFRIVSHRSPFEVSVSSQEFARMAPGGMFAKIEDRVVGSSI